jgi:hypothetical protein
MACGRLGVSGWVSASRLVDETDQKSATFADALAETIRDLQNGEFTVCSIVTDNASKNARPSILGVDETVADFIWDHSLRSGEYKERQRSLKIPDASGLRHVLWRPVADITLIASRLPCSEAGVERASPAWD